MKKYDLVSVKNKNPYRDYRIKNDMHGVVMDSAGNMLEVLFFNPKNVGECILVNMDINDVVVEDEKIPENLKNEISEKLSIIKSKAKEKFTPIKVKAYDMVELLVEDNKYSQYGIHKGDRGCVVDDNAVSNYVEVDFSGIDKNGNFYGDCISVKIDDLKVIK